MATLDRQKERISGMAKGARNEPRWLRSAITVSSIIMLVGLAMMVTAGKTGHVNLAWAGVSSFCVGTVGWLISFGWLTVLAVGDVWASRDSYRISFRKIFSRGGNHDINTKTE
ncbi:MAG: hypothetical protein J4G13_07255 [Dehalococcoidia bacterium]|nr:hypothetical protein [Dehalococcoidia bacterium]